MSTVKKEIKMALITEKELSAIEDMLSVEKNLIAKYQEFAEMTTDPALKTKYCEIALRHQRHYDELYCNIK